MKKINNFNAIALALSPAFAVYSILPGVKLDTLCWLFLLPITLLFGGNNKFDRNTIGLYVCVLILTVFNSIHFYSNTQLTLHNLFPLTICFGVLVIIKNNINIDLFRKTLVFVGCLASAICIYQRMQLIATGTYDNFFFIPGLEVARDLDTFSWYRPSAFFTEPAHLSIFLLPIYYWMLSSNKFALASIMALGILFSGSTTGFLLVVVLLAYYIWTSERRSFYFNAAIIGGTIIGVVLISHFANNVITGNFEKLTQDDNVGSLRLLGGLKYIGAMNFYENLVGIGLNQLEGFCRISRLEFIGNYSNALIYSYISYGIIGFIALVVYLCRLWKSTSKDRGFFIILIGVLASDQVLFNRNLYYTLMFVILSCTLLYKDSVTESE